MYDQYMYGDPTVSGLVVGTGGNTGYSSQDAPGNEPSVLGTSSTNTDWGTLWNTAWNTGYNQANSSSNPYSGQSGGGYDIGQAYTLGQQKYLADRTAGTSSGPGTPTAPSAPSPNYNDALLAEINNIYNETMGVAGQKENAARENKASMEGDVMSQYGANQQSLQTSKGAGERDIESSEQLAGQTKDSALIAGRRLAGELQIGNQQRFGGKSPAGQFVSEMIGREQQRGQAQTYQAFQNAATKIMDMKQTLQERFDTSMQNLMVQKDNAINEVRRWFTDKLGEIDTLRAEAGINKSTQRLEVLQNLRNQVYQINLAATQTQANLNQQLQAQQAELDKYSGLLTQNTTNLGENQNQLASIATANPQTSLGISSGGMGQTQQYTGRIKKDEYTGIASPRKEEYMFA